jgi:DNA-binding NarL/FixJ family response regulator
MASETTAKVRDLTSAPRHIPIEVEGTVGYEVLLAIWRTHNPKERPDSFDLGSDWHEKIKSRLDPDLAAEIEAIGGPHAWVWLAVIGLLATAPHPHAPDQMYRWLAGLDHQRLMRWLIGYCSHQGDAALIEQASTGDREALAQILHEEKGPEKIDHLISLLESAETLPERIADAINGFRVTAFVEDEEEFAGAVARAAAARRAAPTRADAKTVIEDVTAGLEYDIPLGVTRVVLAPSVVTRPLSLIDQHRETLMVFYAVADEFISDDPEAPPSWLVRTYKALSDERRLRILRRLAESETTLDELAEMLDLSKSTVHHHISVLRAAGLVRVRLSEERANAYGLRDRPLGDASSFLVSYLQTDTKGENHG